MKTELTQEQKAQNFMIGCIFWFVVVPKLVVFAYHVVHFIASFIIGLIRLYAPFIKRNFKDIARILLLAAMFTATPLSAKEWLVLIMNISNPIAYNCLLGLALYFSVTFLIPALILQQATYYVVARVKTSASVA